MNIQVKRFQHMVEIPGDPERVRILIKEGWTWQVPIVDWKLLASLEENVGIPVMLFRTPDPEVYRIYPLPEADFSLEVLYEDEERTS